MSGVTPVVADSGGAMPPDSNPAPTVTIRQEWGDLAVGGAILAMAAWFYATAGTIEDFSGGGIGAADFPQGIAALLGLGTLVILVGALSRLLADGRGRTIVIRRYRHVAGGMVLLVAFPALMESFGFYLAMTPWLAAFLVLAGERRPLHVIAYVAGFLLFTKVTFEMILGTPLP